MPLFNNGIFFYPWHDSCSFCFAMVGTVKILDLFCSAGGASMGYYNYFHSNNISCSITGIDIMNQKHYPFSFVLGDVQNISFDFLSQFDIVHASPPCQKYSRTNAIFKNNPLERVDLLPFTLDLLQSFSGISIIENIEGAPLRPDFKLSGIMFNLPIVRVRWFQVNNIFALSPLCPGTNSKIRGKQIFTVAGNGSKNDTLKNWSSALDIDWMNRKELIQAIPPAYTFFLCQQLNLKSIFK